MTMASALAAKGEQLMQTQAGEDPGADQQVQIGAGNNQRQGSAYTQDSKVPSLGSKSGIKEPPEAIGRFSFQQLLFY